MNGFLYFAPVTAIGFLAVGWVVAAVLSETIRAARQSRRIVIAHLRWHSGLRRQPTAKEWWGSFVQDWYAAYDYTTIGPFRLDRNPSVKARLDW